MSALHLRPKLRHLVLALGLLVTMAAQLPAAADGLVLRGRITDTANNWLPDVRVRLLRAGVETSTDPNGLFELPLGSAELPAPGPDGLRDTLRLDKEGFRPRLVPIREAAYFARPATEKMKPNPVGPDNVGFTMLFPERGSIHALPEVLGLKLDSSLGLDVGRLREALDRVARREGDQLTDAHLHAWVPPGLGRLRAAFLHSLHGMGTIDHPAVRRFAIENAIGLVAVEGNSIQRGYVPVAAFDEPLRRLGRLTGHPELADVPVLTFGHSNGTGFATVYATERPERLIGWISFHSGWDWHLRLPGVEKAPGLVMHGQLDKYLEHGQEQAVADLRRRRHAPVSMMLEGNVGHGPVDRDATWEFIVAFCRSVLRLRLADDGLLRPVEIERGWLGGRYDRARGGQQKLAIAPYADFAGDRSIANWLPDREFAETWQRYGLTNPRERVSPDGDAPRKSPQSAP